MRKKRMETQKKNHTMKRYFLIVLIAAFVLAGCGKSEPIRQPFCL